MPDHAVIEANGGVFTERQNDQERGHQDIHTSPHSDSQNI
jgi:hypothetical protein